MIKKTSLLLSAFDMYENGIIDNVQLMNVFYKVRGIKKTQKKRPVGRPKKFDVEINEA